MPTVTIPGGATAAALRAHLAVPPTGDGPWPAVVVLHEAFGLNDDVRSAADRLAGAGYVAVAPDLFTAGGARRCFVRTFRALLAGTGPVFDDIEAVRVWAAEGVGGAAPTTGRVGTIGFCMGGGFALATAARGFDAAAPNYGVLPKDLDGALRGSCPMVASYGGRDRGLPGAAARLEEGLARAGVAHDVREYPDAGHSFLNRHNLGPLAPVLRVAGLGYHGPSAEDAWARILRFFGEHLDEPVAAG